MYVHPVRCEIGQVNGSKDSPDLFAFNFLMNALLIFTIFARYLNSATFLKVLVVSVFTSRLSHMLPNCEVDILHVAE